MPYRMGVRQIMRAVLMGPPSAGKGTQAARLGTEFGVPHISTGDMFRAAIAAGTDLGQQARGFIEAGKLVPDDVTMGIVRERLAEADARLGFVLDGFPRTVPQAEGLGEILASQDVKLDVVVLIEVPEEELIRRATGRRICQQCGRVYHIEWNPPPGHACECGGALVQRKDDSPETVKERLATYRTQTEPLRDYYSAEGSLAVVDGTGDPDEVHRRIVRVFEGCSL
jgi:adenylate kinase